MISTPYIITLLCILIGKTHINKKEKKHIEVLAFEVLRGVFALQIVTVHFLSFISKDYSVIKDIFDHAFIMTGYFAVSAFFLFSGYGLFVSYSEKDNYLDNFVIKSFVKLFVPFSICNIIYYIWHYLSPYGYEELLPKQFFLSFFSSNNTDNSWYVFVIFWCYLFFFIAFNNSLSEKKKIVLFTVIILTFNIIQIIMLDELSSDSIFSYLRQYYSTVVIVLGVLYARIESKIKIKRVDVKFILLLLNFIAIFCAHKYVYLDNRIRLLGHENGLFTSILVGLFIVQLCGLFDFSKKTVCRKLGEISFEIYLIHGLFIEIGAGIQMVWFAGDRIATFVIYLLVIFATILSSIFIHRLSKKIIRNIYKLLKMDL